VTIGPGQIERISEVPVVVRPRDGLDVVHLEPRCDVSGWGRVESGDDGAQRDRDLCESAPLRPEGPNLPRELFGSSLGAGEDEPTLGIDGRPQALPSEAFR